MTTELFFVFLFSFILASCFLLLYLRLHLRNNENQAALIRLSVQLKAADAQVSQLRTLVGDKEEDIKLEKLRLKLAHNKMSEYIGRNDLLTDKLGETEKAFLLFKKEEVPKIRKEAIKKSNQVNNGFTSENFAMFLQNDLSPKDFRHLGDPIDFMVTCGAEDIRNGISDEVSEIILLDVKTGNASLTKIQRRIRDAVVAGRVSFATLTINDEGVNYRFWRSDED